jgi:hypothetical protein
LTESLEKWREYERVFLNISRRFIYFDAMIWEIFKLYGLGLSKIFKRLPLSFMPCCGSYKMYNNFLKYLPSLFKYLISIKQGKIIKSLSMLGPFCHVIYLGLEEQRAGSFLTYFSLLKLFTREVKYARFKFCF